MTETGSTRTVLCFGELLWDCLPRGLFLGGAPANVAYHLNHQGLCAWPVSAVGDDFLGREALRRLGLLGVPADGVRTQKRLQTGAVVVDLDGSGAPRYDILNPVAWDDITPSRTSLAAAQKARALVFGSLAQRGPVNRRSLDALLASLAPDAWRVFDVNLRAPFIDWNRIRVLAKGATLLKLNAQEMEQWPGVPERESLDARAGWLAAETEADGVCLTDGARGAGLWWKGAWHWEEGRKLKVADTVGAGDALLSGLLAGLLKGEAPGAALERGARLAEWVVQSDGPTPDYAKAPK